MTIFTQEKSTSCHKTESVFFRMYTFKQNCPNQLLQYTPQLRNLSRVWESTYWQKLSKSINTTTGIWKIRSLASPRSPPNLTKNTPPNKCHHCFPDVYSNARRHKRRRQAGERPVLDHCCILLFRTDGRVPSSRSSNIFFKIQRLHWRYQGHFSQGRGRDKQNFSFNFLSNYSNVPWSIWLWRNK